ncbi:MAG: glycosyltransferase family 4 protein, partial [Candidatus Cloacimonetes bacterium]|nr:glycosyltransferase family 4 protein [Candidatus Cloacimonadota bacterium]
KGYDVRIFCASVLHNSQEDAVDLQGNISKELIVDGIPFVFVKTRKYQGNGFSRVLGMFDYYLNVKKACQQYSRPDVIIGSSVHPLACVAAIHLSKRYSCKNIVEIRDLWPESIFAFGKAKQHSIVGKVLSSGEYWIYRNAHALIFTKEGDVDHIKEEKWDTEHGGKIELNKCFYVNNGVNIENFDKQCHIDFLHDEDLENSSTFKVIYTGAIRPVNDVGNILDCAKYLTNSNIRFLVYGDGMELEKLKKRVKDENITNVRMKGRVEKKYIPFILSHSSINLLNYAQDQYNWSRGNSSNKLFEYMASGKPIISTVKMGYSIIDKYDCGIELEESTTKQLAEAILKIYRLPSDEYQKIGMNARRGSKDFDYSILTNKLDEVIKSVAND